MVCFFSLDVFGGVPVHKKTWNSCLGARFVVFCFRVFPGHFYSIRGPSLVELAGDYNSATLAVTVQI